MSMTPFEIRLELLKMAKDMMEHDYHAHKDMLRQMWETEVVRANETNAPIPPSPIIPPFPTASEVIEKANTLNKFVSNV